MMKTILKILGILFFIFVLKSMGLCQGKNVLGGNITQENIFITIAAEPELVATIGYLHAVGNSKHFKIGAAIKAAPLIILKGAWRVNLTAATDWKLSKKWINRFTTNIYLVHDQNREGVMNGFGLEIRDNLSVSGRKWTKGFDFGWQYTPFTHIRHSKEAKAAFEDRYPEDMTGVDGPRDGWYKNGASRFRIGLIGVTKLGKKGAFQISAGSLINIQRQGVWLGFSHAQVPAYWEFGYEYYW